MIKSTRYFKGGPRKYSPTPYLFVGSITLTILAITVSTNFLFKWYRLVLCYLMITCVLLNISIVFVQNGKVEIIRVM